MASAVTLHTGDCLNVLRDMPADSVDSIVTDPPYGLSFMGKAWDKGVPSVEVWAEALRVLKPGGYILAFAGTRTQHRMACAIEDAGFEMRDIIAWVYGSGFPKSLDVSKGIDKALNAAGSYGGPKTAAHAARSSGAAAIKRFGHRPWHDDPEAVARTNAAYLPGTPEAAEWEGWGTALKPALEPITVARKPLAGTVAKNVLEYGTGAMNIDGCRVDGGARPLRECDPKASANGAVYAGRREAGNGFDGGSRAAGETSLGRWPANLIHDGSDEVLACFPDAKGHAGAVGPEHGAKTSVNTYGDYGPRTHTPPRGASGSAARFFYCAKASKADRGEGNNHPTVKPTYLMRYLCRLVTPPGGVVLDPFMGSGSTGRGAVLEGFGFIGIEADAGHVEIARARIAAAQRAAEEAARQPDMFARAGEVSHE